MKKLRMIPILVIILIVFTGIRVNAENTVSNYDKAEALMSLGLFKGTLSGYELESVSTRAQGAVMLVRLLGREEYIRNRTYKHPFKDVPDWADSQVGYMYTQRLTNGTSKTTYRPDLDLQAIHYMTFLLRALGYNDSAGEFHYTKSLEKALEIGLIDFPEYVRLSESEHFIRDDMVKLSYAALSMQIKGYNKTLIEKLIENDKTVSSAAASFLGLYDSEKARNSLEDFVLLESGYIVSNDTELMDLICVVLQERIRNLRIDFSEYSGEIDESHIWDIMDRAKTAIQQSTGFYNAYSYSYLQYETSRFSDDDKLIGADIIIEYYLNKPKATKLDEEAGTIISKIILPEMSEYDKVKAVHDYVAKTAEYQSPIYSYDENIYTAYGALINGNAAGEGYAEAVGILLFRAGVKSAVVTGEAFKFNSWVSHAWNIVRIDGKYYHLDAAFDDPLSNDGLPQLRYDYMNITDAEIAYDHRWNSDEYPVCNDTVNNYYYRNGLMAADMTEFQIKLDDALNSRQDSIILKIGSYEPSDLSNLSKLIFSNEGVLSYSSDININMGIVKIFDIEYVKVR